MSDPSREALLVQAKRQIDVLETDHLAILLPLLYMPLREIRDLLQVVKAMTAVRAAGFGHVEVVVHDGKVTLVKRLLQEKLEF